MSLMPETENVALEPSGDRIVNLVKLAGKEVVRAFHNYKMALTRKGRDQ